jgi:hypothetical protein
VQEYQRRIAAARATNGIESDRRQDHVELKSVKAREDRITEAYLSEAMDLGRYKVEWEKLKHHRLVLEGLALALERRERHEADGRAALEHLGRFCQQVSAGLDAMSFEEGLRLIQLVVERITVDDGTVSVETVIPNGPDDGQLRTLRPVPVEGRAA